MESERKSRRFSLSQGWAKASTRGQLPNSLSEATVGCETLEGFERSLAVHVDEQMFDFV